MAMSEIFVTKMRSIAFRLAFISPEEVLDIFRASFSISSEQSTRRVSNHLLLIRLEQISYSKLASHNFHLLNKSHD